MIAEQSASAVSYLSRKQNKRKRNSNPLSQARGKQKKHENVWFRRSNAGYALFVQYYMGQPDGTICSSRANDSFIGGKGGVDCQKDFSYRSSDADLVQKRQGKSRAARRRNKKKQKQENGRISDGVITTAPAVETKVKTIFLNEEPLSLLESVYSKFAGTKSATATHETMGFVSFLQAMSRPLPLSFRFREYEKDSEDVTTAFGKALERLRQHDFAELLEAVPFGNTTIYRASPSRSLGSRDVLCKERLNQISPSLKDFLVEMSQSGILARQEIGSMLPVLALHDVGSLRVGTNVLDVCASPGSKTLQALEVVGCKGRYVAENSVFQYDITNSHTFFLVARVVANDVSESRLETLKQALERSGMPSALLQRIHFTCQDGSRLEPPQLKSSATKKMRSFEFNAVICDVPCSGDGTCRKDKHILPMWKPNYGNELHSLQLKILMRALKLVKVGGVVCYSTCTLNPIEDEAVIAAALSAVHRSSKDKKRDKPTNPTVELVEWPTLPGDLIRRNGISQWSVAEFLDTERSMDDSDGEENEEGEETPKLHWYASYKNDSSCSLPSTMWPPTPSQPMDFHLERCTRLWPQDRDTGGFFLALLRKNHEFH
eukprot:scaffold332_cov117-Cylindrotheca_fusiformis.AAC.11